MGFTAETDWHLAFTSHAALAACRTELDAGIRGDTGWGWTFALDPGLDPETAEDWLGNVGEYADGTWTDRGPDTGPVLVGTTSGKYTLDNWALDVLAAHAQGTINGHSEDGALWRVRLHDGQATWHGGTVIYPSDQAATENPVAEALTAAILALNTPPHPEATAGDQWDWLDTPAGAHQHTLTQLRDWVQAQGEDLDLGQDSRLIPTPHLQPGGGPDPSVTVSIDTITRPRDWDPVGERWDVTGRVEVLGVEHDFTYAYQDYGHSVGLDQPLTVTLDGADQGYDGWQWGEPPTASASLIARRVDHEWLVDVIREASVQKVWDAHYDAETAAITTIAATTSQVARPGAATGSQPQRTATNPTPAAAAAGQSRAAHGQGGTGRGRR